MTRNNKETKGILSRRDFIQTTSVGVGTTAIAALSANEAKAISPSQVSRWDHGADVVILGTGFAGQVSAIAHFIDGASSVSSPHRLRFNSPKNTF